MVRRKARSHEGGGGCSTGKEGGRKIHDSFRLKGQPAEKPRKSTGCNGKRVNGTQVPKGEGLKRIGTFGWWRNAKTILVKREDQRQRTFGNQDEKKKKNQNKVNYHSPTETETYCKEKDTDGGVNEGNGSQFQRL